MRQDHGGADAEGGATSGDPPIAGRLAQRMRALFDTGLDTAIRAHTTATALTAIGAAIGASQERAVDLVVSLARTHGGAACAPVPGRPELLDPLNAALATGLAAHLPDLDDTRPTTVVRPDATGPGATGPGATGPDATMLGAAVLGAAIATASPTSTTGAAFLDALALGIEAQLRIATAMRPWHDDAGWHLTGTVGPIGAAVTAGLLGGLTDVQLGQAVSIATSLTLGHREGFGTMVEPFHAGKAAANGVLAARLAARGFTGSPTAIEGPRGYLRVLAERSAPELIGQDLGRRWELLTGTARPRTDAELDDMVTQLVEPVWPGHAATLIATVRSVATAPSCHELLRILTKEPS